MDENFKLTIFYFCDENIDENFVSFLERFQEARLKINGTVTNNDELQSEIKIRFTTKFMNL